MNQYVTGAVSSDKIQIVKLYSEGEIEARFKISGVKYLYVYCNKDGLFRKKIKYKEIIENAG